MAQVCPWGHTHREICRVELASSSSSSISDSAAFGHLLKMKHRASQLPKEVMFQSLQLVNSGWSKNAVHPNTIFWNKYKPKSVDHTGDNGCCLFIWSASSAGCMGFILSCAGKFKQQISAAFKTPKTKAQNQRHIIMHGHVCGEIGTGILDIGCSALHKE